MYSSYVSPADLYLLVAVLGLLCLILAYATRQVRVRVREDAAERQGWRHRAEASEGQLRRERLMRASEIRTAVAYETERRKAAQDRAGELAGMYATSQRQSQELAARVRQLEGDLWNARHAHGADVRRLLEGSHAVAV